MDGDSTTNQIKEYTVGIKTMDRTDLGTGTIVTTDGIVATCFHVIKNKGENMPYESVKIYFSPDLDPMQKEYDAEVLVDKSNEKYDIAFVQFYDKSIPEFAKTAPLSSHIQTRHSFRSFGFSEIEDFVGLPASGTIDDIVNHKINGITESNKQETIRVIKLTSSEIAGGISGAPIYDEKQQKVIGLASNYNYTEANVNRDLAIAIPIKSIIEEFPLIEQKNPSLAENKIISDASMLFKSYDLFLIEFQKELHNDGYDQSIFQCGGILSLIEITLKICEKLSDSEQKNDEMKAFKKLLVYTFESAKEAVTKNGLWEIIEKGQANGANDSKTQYDGTLKKNREEIISIFVEPFNYKS